MSDVTSVMEIVLVLRKFTPVGTVWCYINVFLKTFSFSQSMMFITLVAVVRAWSGLSRHSIGLSVNKAISCVIVVYVLSIVWSCIWILPGVFGINECMGQIQQWSHHRAFAVLIFLIIVIILFITTIGSYFLLIIWMRCKNVTNASFVKKSEILTLKAAKTVSTIFIACYLIPFLPAALRLVNLVPMHHVIHILYGFNSLACLQSALNPYVYLATNAHFRRIYWRSLRRLFIRITRRHPRQVTPINIITSSQVHFHKATIQQHLDQQKGQNVQKPCKHNLKHAEVEHDIEMSSTSNSQYSKKSRSHLDVPSTSSSKNSKQSSSQYLEIPSTSSFKCSHKVSVQHLHVSSLPPIQ